MSASSKPVEETTELTDEFVSLNEFKKWSETGQSLTGVYAGYEFMDIRDQTSGGTKTIAKHAIFEDLGGLVSFLHSSQLSILGKVPAGTRIRVVFTGQIDIGARRVKTFNVQIPKSQMTAITSNNRPNILMLNDAPEIDESKIDPETGEIRE